MNFDEFKTHVKSIPVPEQRMGIFNLVINYRNKRYDFFNLKENFSANDDLTGFGLNHHYSNVRSLPSRESIFHDSEDISIDIWRDLFINAEKRYDNTIEIKTKKWTGILSIEE